MRWRLLKNSGSTLFVGSIIAAIAAAPVLAVTTVQSQVCQDFAAPAIVSPGDGTQTKETTAMIEGTGEPGKSVAVLRNGNSQGVGIIASDGTFGFTVSLVQGDNVMIAREVNECDTVKDSSSVTIHADLPQPPIEEPPVTQPVPDAGGDTPSGQLSGQLGTENIGKPFTPSPSTSGFQKPKLSASNKGLTVYNDTLLIEGTAYPGSLLTVYVNDRVQAQLFASKQGTFRLRVVLREGRNTLRIRSDLGTKTSTSDEVAVTYIKRVTAYLSRPLSQGEIVTTAAAAGAAVIGSAGAALGANAVLHRYRIRLKSWRRK